MNLSNAIVDKVSTQKDGSLKITLITRSLSPQQLAEIFCSINQEIISIDVPDVTVDKDEKSPSTRLRATLWRIWEQNYKDKVSPYTTFTIYYNSIMEQLINKYQELLN